MGTRPKQALDRFFLCPACGRYARVYVASSQVHARCACTLFVSAVGQGPAEECLYAQTIRIPFRLLGVEAKVATREQVLAWGLDPEPRPEPLPEVPAGAADRGGAGGPPRGLAGAGGGFRRGPGFRELGAGEERREPRPVLRGHDPAVRERIREAEA